MTSWCREDNIDRALKFFLFFISPFIGALYALRRINTRSSYIIFFLFALFFGMAYTIEVDHSFDGAAYRKWFESYFFISSNTFKTEFTKFLSFDKGKKDFYFDTLAFFISRFTRNYHWFFFVSAIPFAFFSLKSLKFLTGTKKLDLSYESWILISLFMINQIFNINGLRFWTAAWIAVYLSFQIFKNSKNIYLVILFILPFIHASFWIFIIVVFLAKLVMRFEKVLIAAFFLSFLLSSLTIGLITSLASSLPSFLENFALTYVDHDYVRQRAEEGSGFIWVKKFMDFLVFVSTNVMVYLFIKNRNLVTHTLHSKNIYLFLIVYMIFVNLTMPIPSLGVRYLKMAYPFIAYLWLINFKGVKYKTFLQLLPFLFWFLIFEQIIQYAAVTDFYFYFSSPIILVIKYLYI